MHWTRVPFLLSVIYKPLHSSKLILSVCVTVWLFPPLHRCSSLILHSSRSWERLNQEGEPKDRRTQEDRQDSYMFVFLGQWCLTPLPHHADCLPSLHVHTWPGMILPATLSTFTALQWFSNNNTVLCHWLTPACLRLNKCHQSLHECS